MAVEEQQARPEIKSAQEALNFMASQNIAAQILVDFCRGYLDLSTLTFKSELNMGLIVEGKILTVGNLSPWIRLDNCMENDLRLLVAPSREKFSWGGPDTGYTFAGKTVRGDMGFSSASIHPDDLVSEYSRFLMEFFADLAKTAAERLGDIREL